MQFQLNAPRISSANSRRMVVFWLELIGDIPFSCTREISLKKGRLKDFSLDIAFRQLLIH